MSIELLKSISTQKEHKTCYKQGSKLHYLGTNQWLVSRSLMVFALPFAGLKQLLPLQFIVSNRLACDHESLSRLRGYCLPRLNIYMHVYTILPS